MSVKYYSTTKDGKKDSQISIPTNAGKYIVEFEIIDTSNKTMWSNYATDSSAKREITYEIDPKEVRFTLTGGGTTPPKVEHNTADLAAPDSGSAQGTILGFQYDTLPGAFPEYHGTTLPTANGTYTATVISIDPNYTPNKTTTPSSVTFSVTGKMLTVPTIDTKSLPYTGSQVGFSLKDFDSATMEVVTSSLPTGVTFDNIRSFNATKAGKYKVKIALKDKTGSMYWSSGVRNDTADKEVEFEITPYKLSVSVDTDNNSGKIKVAANSKVTLTALITGFPIGTDVVNMLFSAEDDPYKYNLSYNLPSSTTSVSTGYPVNALNANVNVELNTGSLSQRTWDFVLKSDNPNYEFDVTPSGIKLEVVAPTQTTAPTWLLMRNGSRIDIQFGKLGDTTPVNYAKALTYNDRYTYEFKMLAPNGLTLDTSYGSHGDGYVVVAGKGSNNSALGKNADTYTTSVRLLDDDGNATVYTITWTIDPVKFDLSGIKWLNNGQLPYSGGSDCEATLDPKTLPAGLVPTYGNNKGTTVGMSGSASVSFTLDPAYVGNYIEPDESDPNTFTDPNSDFEWSKTWNIVPATIQASSWKNESYTDSNNKAFDVPVLRDPNAAGGIVTYEYYECDPMGNITNNTPITAIVWSESDAKYYIAKPILQDTNNYTLDDPSAQSKVFRVGKDLTKVQVSLEKDTMEYNTNPRHATVKVADAAVPNTAFELTYYDGYTRLATAPTEVGKYRVEVSLKSSYIDKYQIDGNYEFDYEITRAQIAIDWNRSAKPNVLNLKYGQINGVEYEIVDKDGAVVAYNDLKAGETYKIRAKIKDNQLANFIFADGTIETDWQEFSVSADDKLYDPNSPSNPSYPTTDPDLPGNNGDNSNPSGNNPGGSDGDGNGIDFGAILQKFKDYPIWQIIAIVISLILTIIFLAKTAKFDNERKKYKKKTDKLDTSVYAMAYLGAPPFLGIAMSIWTAIACVMIGLAVVSLIMMIAAKSRRNKAEEIYEESLEEYNRNQKDLDERKREAEYSRRDDEYRRHREEDNMRREEEYRRRDEDMQMMFMRMFGGANMGPGPDGAPQGGGAYMGFQRGMAPEDVRAIISDTVTALLPGMQQMLPQPASNDNTIKELIDKNDKNMQKMMERNDERMNQMMKNQEMLIEKLLERNDERPLAAAVAEPQIIEKVVEVPVEVEKIVEKEVPVEKIVEVPVEVEKIIEKEVPV
ncbi:MAG: hypothetical protein K2N53_03835, partial [Clostridia bacterium]|nr:hypothetical protein [Clostridia bacterium]